MPQRVTFAAFGYEFLNQALSERTLQQRLDAAIPRQVPVNQGEGFGSATGRARVGSCYVRRLVSDRLADPNSQISFDVTIPLQLTLFVNLSIAQENYEMTAHVHLRIWVETQAPLAIFIDALPVPPAAVTLEVRNAGNWINLARNAGGLEDKVKAAIASSFTAEWQKTGAQRLVDVGGLIRQSMGGGRAVESVETLEKEPGDKGGARKANLTEAYERLDEPYSGQPLDAGEVTTARAASQRVATPAIKVSEAGDSVENAAPAAKGQTLEGSVAPGSSAYYRIALAEGEKATFAVYGKKSEKSHWFIEASFAIQDAEGGNLDDTRMLVDSAGDFAKEKIVITADEAGDHLFRLQNPSEEETLIYKIKVS